MLELAATSKRLEEGGTFLKIFSILLGFLAADPFRRTKLDSRVSAVRC